MNDKRVALTMLRKLLAEVESFRRLSPEAGYKSAQFVTWRAAVLAQLKAGFGDGHPYVRAFNGLHFAEHRDLELRPRFSQLTEDSF